MNRDLRTKSSKILLARAEKNLKGLKEINKKLQNYIDRFDTEELDQNDVDQINRNWKKGIDQVKQIETLSKVFEERRIEPELVDSINKLSKMSLRFKNEFQGFLQKINDYNMVSYTSVITQHQRSDEELGILQEKLIQDDIKVEEVIEQDNLVKERHQNISEIHRELGYLKEMSSQMFVIVREDDEKLNMITKQQDDIVTEVLPQTQKDLIETGREFSQMTKKVLCWTCILAGILLSVIGLIYLESGKKKKANFF